MIYLYDNSTIIYDDHNGTVVWRGLDMFAEATCARGSSPHWQSSAETWRVPGCLGLTLIAE